MELTNNKWEWRQQYGVAALLRINVILTSCHAYAVASPSVAQSSAGSKLAAMQLFDANNILH
jgi:hypothetical protein